MRAKFIKEDMGGVSVPMATPLNVPGVGTAVPPGANRSTGSGDRWDNNTAKKSKKKAKGPFSKPATQSKNLKVKKLKENNINPYDKGKLVREHL